MNDKINALVTEALSMDEENLKAFELELRTQKKTRNAAKKATEKETKAADKEAKHKAGIAKVNELGIGKDIEVSYKDGTVTGTIMKIGEKTFTITLQDENGEDKNLFRYFYQVI